MPEKASMWRRERILSLSVRGSHTGREGAACGGCGRGWDTRRCCEEDACMQSAHTTAKQVCARIAAAHSSVSTTAEEPAANNGGSGTCEHNRQRRGCKECCGSSICEHNHRRSGSNNTAGRASITREQPPKELLQAMQSHMQWDGHARPQSQKERVEAMRGFGHPRAQFSKSACFQTGGIRVLIMRRGLDNHSTVRHSLRACDILN
jgi:hypothetical protein